MNMQEQISTINDISERETIIINYLYYGIFDVNKALDKIIEFKLSNANANIFSVILIEQMRNSICRSYYSDIVIIQELIKQIKLLKQKLVYHNIY